MAPGVARAFERHRYDEYPELEGKSVEQVLLLGNNKTQDVVILREMRTTPGQPFRSHDLWRDWERIVDLGLFAEVEVDAVPSGDNVLAVVSMFERPSWFAAPVLNYDYDEEKFTTGLQVRLLNIHGMNQQLRARVLVGGRDSYSLSWTTPWLGSQKQSLAAEGRVELPEETNDEIRTSLAAVSTSRFLGDYKSARQGVNANARVEFLRRDASLAVDGSPTVPGVDEVSPVVGLGVFRDNRNVRIDPDRGHFLSAGAEYASSWSSKDVDYLRGQIDLRGFHHLSDRWIIAGRANTILTTGTVPDYREITVGGPSSIRGQPSEVVRGTSIGRSSVELRVRLLRARRVAFKIPLVPEKIGRLANFDFRVDGEIFADAGTAWKGSGGFDKAPVKIGSGFGFRVFLPFFELVRLELAFDERGNATFYFREGNII